MNQVFFDQETYHMRRAALAAAVGQGVIVLPANEDVGMNYKDNTYPYRQDSTFLYYCGISRPGLMLYIHCATGESVLAGDEATLEDVIWTGPVESIRHLADQAGIDRVITTTEGYTWINNCLQAGLEIHYLPPYRGEQIIFLARLLSKSTTEITEGSSKKLCRAVVHQREIKSEAEITQLNIAVNNSKSMHVTMMRTAKTGMSEAQLMAKVRADCLSKNVDISYPIILSVNGQTLHNHYYHNIIKSGQLILGDFGADSPMFYAGDITRTIPADATFTTIQKEIYQLVLKTLTDSIARVKEGVKYFDVHKMAAKTIAAGMVDLGFLKGSSDDIVEAGAHALFFPHGLGHPLGLDVHDMENIGEHYTGYDEETTRSTQFGWRSLRLGKTLLAGMVLTVEPGIYFIPELISKWKSENKFKDFILYDRIEKQLPFGGIRLEDNVLVETTGAIILGEPIPKTISQVEELRYEAYQ